MGYLACQAFFSALLNDMLSQYIIVYRDDILIYYPDEESQIKHIKAVLGQLLENHLYIKAEKYEYHVSQLTLLGYVISAEGVSTDT